MLVKRARINIVEIILDLRRAPHRMKFRSIAAAINVPVDTLKAWFYRASMPDLDDGLALLALHKSITESCTCNPNEGEKRLKPSLHARESVNEEKETNMATALKPRNLNAPGSDPHSAESDVDAAIEAGHAGKARRISRPKPDVGPAKVRQLDTQRPKSMPVNQRAEMSYEEAMVLHESGQQTRAILTPEGWVAPPLKTPQAAKAGVA